MRRPIGLTITGLVLMLVLLVGGTQVMPRVATHVLETATEIPYWLRILIVASRYCVWGTLAIAVLLALAWWRYLAQSRATRAAP